MPEHYWGAKAIVQRLGLKSPARLPDLIKHQSFPAYRRRLPGRSTSPYYSNSDLVLRWELSKASHYREQLLAEPDKERG